MNEQIKKNIKSFQTIYIALISGLIGFIAVTFYLNYFDGGLHENNDIDFTNILLLVAVIGGVSSILGGIYIFNKRTDNIEKKDIGDKLNIYRSAMIVRAATIEGATFFFIVIYLLTASIYGLFGAITGLMILIWFFPTTGRLSNELKHNFKDLKYE